MSFTAKRKKMRELLGEEVVIDLGTRTLRGFLHYGFLDDNNKFVKSSIDKGLSGSESVDGEKVNEPRYYIFNPESNELRQIELKHVDANRVNVGGRYLKLSGIPEKVITI